MESGSYTRFEVFQLTGGQCYLCLEPLEAVSWRPGGWEVEHIVPVSRGGRDDISNVLPACRPCNVAKGELFIDEMAA